MKTTLVLVALAAAAIVPTTALAITRDAPSDVRVSEATTPSPTLKVRTTRFGKILFAGNGRVLYGFTRDRRNGPSQCYGDRSRVARLLRQGHAQGRYRGQAVAARHRQEA